jgi:hypothetical protein
MSLETRVASLEREVRRWRVAACVTVVVCAAVIGLAAQTVSTPPEVIRAKRIEAEHIALILDGKERAALAVDDQGKDNRSPGLFLYRDQGPAGSDWCARFAVFGQTQEPELVLKGRNGHFRVWTQIQSDGTAMCSVHDDEGKVVDQIRSR